MMHEHTVRGDLLHLVEEAHDQVEGHGPLDVERRSAELPREWGIDPNVDLDSHILVAVPKCPTCRGSGWWHSPGPGTFSAPANPADEHVCRTCKGTGVAGKPVWLDERLAELIASGTIYPLLQVAREVISAWDRGEAVDTTIAGIVDDDDWIRVGELLDGGATGA